MSKVGSAGKKLYGKAGGFMAEFKAFALRGNVIDLAVGVIIGGAFGKITSSLVSDIIMPLIGVLIAGVNFSEWKIDLPSIWEGAEPVALNIGAFLDAILNFLIIAFCIFLMLKLISNLHKKKAKEPAPPPAEPVPTPEELLLTEIRDLLKEQAAK